LYDENESTEVRRGPGTFVDRRPYELPEPDAGFVDVEDIPPRDWGSRIIPLPVFGYEKDVGVFLGAAAIYTRYGFRKHPWSSQHRLSAGYATEAETGRGQYTGQFRFENSNLGARLDLRASGIEILRFYGFGNNTSDSNNDGFFRVRNVQYDVAPSVRFHMMDDQIRIGAGPWLEFSRTKGGNRLINQRDPYGSGKFGLIGAFANLQIDTRRSPDELEESLTLPLHENPAAGYPSSGFLIDITTEVSPPVWDVDKTWGAIEGSVSGYLSAGDNDRATLSLRVGGRETWGRTPYFKAAFIGGGEFFSGAATVRGLRAQRFAGDSSVFGNLDLRVFLFRAKFIVPTDFGVLGFGDVGRVFEDGKSSKKWHPGAGGGVWLAPLARTNAISLTVGKSDEETLFYLRIGFFY
jgi:hypothetical protein